MASERNSRKVKNLIEMLALSFEMLRYAYATLSMTTLDQLFCGVLLLAQISMINDKRTLLDHENKTARYRQGQRS
ncbi:hypothetical protein WA1_43925 [Scytonema hofmannii PCC 7110]|uniref:Uncharacterized protein n=1 Tax=Scytonema hofmannii PCC 7110 TaxID=128403 RepID=A0A139WW21_9CYAN|nr:hypothetical protein [Scytonema hofmannii]KYC36637.1 hypothetical protein WA1_43925 [Scytonema hofmannii PCC 7110]